MAYLQLAADAKAGVGRGLGIAWGALGARVGHSGWAALDSVCKHHLHLMAASRPSDGGYLCIQPLITGCKPNVSGHLWAFAAGHERHEERGCTQSEQGITVMLTLGRFIFAQKTCNFLPTSVSL